MPRSSLLACIGACSLFGCPSKEPEAAPSEVIADEAPAPAELTIDHTDPPDGTWVLIDERRGLFTTADVEGPRIPIERSAAAPYLRIAEVVAHVGELLEVQTITGDPASACAKAPGIESRYRLRFFVEPEALQSVLARPKRFEFDDGTRLELAAGVPLILDGVRAGITDLVVDIEQSDVAWWFPAPAPGSTIAPATGPFQRELELHYGKQKFMSEGLFLRAHEQQIVEGGQLLTFENACGRFVLRAAFDLAKATPKLTYGSEAELTGRPGILGLLEQQDAPFLDPPEDVDDVRAGLADCTPAWTAPAGTTLSWASGGEAGTVLVSHELPQHAELLDDRVCFEVAGLDVCAKASKLERRGECAGKTLDELTESGAGARTDARLNMLPSEATIAEGLDPDIIRRIIRAHINELHRCYQDGLAEHPTLAGRVEIAFSIDGTGKVASSKVHASTLAPADERVGKCLAKAVKRWAFPKPRGRASVAVIYPFELVTD